MDDRVCRTTQNHAINPIFATFFANDIAKYPTMPSSRFSPGVIPQGKVTRRPISSFPHHEPVMATQ
jgi:hypothetical protein